MKQRVIAALLLLGFTLNPAYANDENDLFSAGAQCIIAPVVLPAMALKKLIEGKPEEAAEMVVATPLMPLMGISMLAVGALVKAGHYLPPPRTTSVMSVEPRIKGISIGKHESYKIETAPPELHIDESHLLSHCPDGFDGHCEQ